MQKEYLLNQVLKEVKSKIEVLDDYSFNEEYNLMALATNKSKEKILLENKLNTKEYKKVKKALSKRVKGVPLNKILPKVKKKIES